MSPNDQVLNVGKAKARLVEAGRQLFHERGYKKTSVEHILKTSGVVRSNFYYHFKSKAELAKAVFEQQVLRYRDQVLAKTLKNPQLQPKERLSVFFDTVVSAQSNWGAKRGSFFAGFAFEFGADESQLRHAVSTYYRALEYALADCLAEGSLQGVFRIDLEPQLLARVIVSALEGAILVAKAHQDLAILTAVSEGLKKLVIA